jgi:hypothetical protein
MGFMTRSIGCRISEQPLPDFPHELAMPNAAAEPDA